MTEAFVLNFAQNALMMALILMAPTLLASLLIGSLISLFQAATQINEATLTFIPKVVGVGLVLAVLGSWMAQQLLAYTANLFRSLPTLPY
ncbi:MAG: flagellar biosynthesis protein FliQ [Anaerolineales bacterium]|nr:flagellar biosynthesis protein FliQ [Anaerolineales bacterium]